MRVLTAAEMKKAEAVAVEKGSSYEILMENAGKLAAETIQKIAEEQALPHTILFLCGKGNNAGDAFVAARFLAGQGWEVCMLALCGEQYSPLAKQNKQRLQPQVQYFTKAGQADFSAAFVCDGVFGTGFSGELPKAVAEIFYKANRADCVRVALDIPSGMDCDTGECSEDTFLAHHTLAFGAYKPGHIKKGNEKYCGQLYCLDIGL